MISLHETSLVQALSCHLRSTAVVSKHSSCCLAVLPPVSPCAPWPARDHCCPCLPTHAHSAGPLSPWELVPRRWIAQQQPCSPEPSCSLTNETAGRDLKASVCQWDKG